jgi:tripartite-type tricarboxylate transporter receptor subunit TctC
MILGGFRRLRVSAFCLLAGLAAAGFPDLAAAAWPERTITLMHGFGAGGNADVIARIVADRLSARLRQPVVVEAKTGAGGRVAAAHVALAPADGYTLFIVVGGYAVSAALYEKLPYDTLGDFTYVSLLTQIPFVLATYPDHPVKSVPDLIKTLQASSNPMFYGTSGAGTTQHLSGALFAAMARVNLQHVASKGGTAVPTMLLGKHIDFVFETPTLTLELVKSGKLRALGTTGKTRFFALPDVPTIGETLAGYETTSWLGLGAPPNLPADIVKRVNAETTALLAEPEVVAKFRALGSLPLASTPEGFKERVATDIAKWTKVVADAGIQKIGAAK